MIQEQSRTHNISGSYAIILYFTLGNSLRGVNAAARVDPA